MSDQQTERLPFPGTKHQKDFDDALTEFITESISSRMGQIIPEENTQHLVHGKMWRHEREDASAAAGGFSKHEAGAEVKAADIASVDLTVLVRFPSQLVEAMHGSTMKSLYETVGKAADEVGNVISAGGRPFTPELFLELLRKVDVGVDRDGSVTMPQLHLHPDMAKKVIPLLQSQGPEFQAEVDAITAEKEREARQREEQRRAKFRKRL